MMKGIRRKEQKELAVSILRRARFFIEERSNSWVCTAIERAAGYDIVEQQKIGQKLTNEIERRLCGYLYVTKWLQSQGIPQSQTENTIFARQYRLRWIDSMIEELK